MRHPSRTSQRVAGLLLVVGFLLVVADHHPDFDRWVALHLLGAMALCAATAILGRAARKRGEVLPPSELEQSPKTLERTLSLARIGTFTFDPMARRVRCSREYSAVSDVDLLPDTWVTLQEFMARSVHPEDRDHLDAWLMSSAESSESPETVFRCIGSTGRVRHFRSIWTSDGGPHRLVVAQDISESKRLEEKLMRGVLYDALTGLPNRSLFDDRLGMVLRRPGRPWIAVAFLDIDRFLAVNASLGREAGDALLLGLAVRLVGILPPGTTVARMGEDEFAALLELDEAQDAQAMASKMKGALASPMLRGTREVSLTASIGVAVARRGDCTAEVLLQNAETALFQARSQGTDSLAVFDAVRGKADQEELALELELRHAVANGELELHYQPVVRLSDLSTVGFEALVRWRRPRVGLVSPALFIPMAERTGAIREIGKWVLEEGIATQVRMAAGKPGCPTMAINLSVKQMEDEDLVETVRECLARHAVDPGMVKLEITESTLAGHPGEAAERVAQIRNLGARVSLDDFGTGYSSLGYLHRFPVDTLKIDKSFVDLLQDEAEASPVPRAVVGLARSLGMEVVAEGIEHSGQLARLKQMECEYGQGYLFARPMPVGDAERWWKEKGRE